MILGCLGTIGKERGREMMAGRKEEGREAEQGDMDGDGGCMA